MLRERKVPARKCVGCQVQSPKRELIRVVLTPEGGVELDLTGKRNGRGAYLCRNPECLRVAKKRKSLDRALKLTVPEPLYDTLTALLEEAIGRGTLEPRRDSGKAR